MIEFLINIIEKTIIPFGSIGVFVASILEEVVAPIPSALVMTMAGFIFVNGPVTLLNIWKIIFYVAIPTSLGVTMGSLLVYGVSWWGGKAALENWGKWIGLYWSDVEKMESRLKGTKKDEAIIVIARIIPFVPSVAISALCGFVRIPLIKYIYLTLIGVFIRGIILGIIGWQTGNLYKKYAVLISKFENVALYLIALAIISFIIFVLFKKYKIKKNRLLK